MDAGAGSIDAETITDADGPRLTPAGDPIMAAKFRAAAIGPPVLLRPRLLARLSAAVEGPLTLISAPAGSGKTVLASSWASTAAAPGPVAWITLDDEDGRSGLFWCYVLAGLARGGLPVSDVGPPRLVDEIDRSLLVRLAVRLSEAADPVVLILDNAERLAGHRVADEIDFVLRHSAGQLRAVLVSRVDPDLPLHRYRLAGSVTEIRFPELAFTADEAKALLVGQTADLSDRAMVAFTDRTNGWAAGLRLGGAPRAGGPAAAGSTAAGGDLAAYFRAEVLEAQPPGFRHLLLTTSVVDPLPAELAVALSGRRDAGTTLRLLAEAAAFVERSADADGSYRYHPLVRELLQAELGREAPARQRALHRKAARWLAAAGQAAEAVGQYAAAGDWPAAARVVIDELAVARLLTTPPDEGLAGAFAGMPAPAPGPCGAVVAAALALSRHDLTTAAAMLPLAAPDAPDAADAADAAAAGPLRLAVAVTAAVLASATGDAEGTVSAAATARGLAAELAGAGRAVPAETLALLELSVGAAHLGRGDLDAARESLGAAARTANLPGYEYLRMRCLGRLALAEAIAGRLQRAVGCANRALALAGSGAAPAGFQPATVDLTLAWVGTEQADGRRGRGCAAAAAANPETSRDPVAVGALALVHSRLSRGRGDLVGAVAALRRARAADPPPPRWLRDRVDAAEAMLLVAQSRADGALSLLGRLSPRSLDGSAGRAGPRSLDGPAGRAGAGGPDDPAGRAGAGGSTGPDDPAAALVLARGWALLETGAVAAAAGAVREAAQRTRLPLDVQVEALLLTAAVELGESRPEAAREALGRAAQLAEPERLRRPFQQAMPRLRRLLREQDVLAGYGWWAGTGATGAHRVGPPHRVGAPAGTPGPGTAPTAGTGVLVQPLTEREREVLTHLAALLSTEEIAGRMFLSVNTVKTHVRAILRKLAAERRNEAVRRARELGLV